GRVTGSPSFWLCAASSCWINGRKVVGICEGKQSSVDLTIEWVELCLDKRQGFVHRRGSCSYSASVRESGKTVSDTGSSGNDRPPSTTACASLSSPRAVSKPKILRPR